MKIIYNHNFDGLNFKVYYDMGNVELYLYVDNEIIQPSFFFGITSESDLFKNLMLGLLPDYLIDLIPTSLDTIANDLTIRLYNYYDGNIFLFEGLDLNYTSDVRDFLYSHFDKYINDRMYEYADNFRYCIKNDQVELDEYMRIKSKGCCGFEDIVVKFKGIEYMIGFNYGH